MDSIKASFARSISGLINDTAKQAVIHAAVESAQALALMGQPDPAIKTRPGWMAAYPYRARRLGGLDRWSVRRYGQHIGTIDGPGLVAEALIKAHQKMDRNARLTAAALHAVSAGLYAQIAQMSRQAPPIPTDGERITVTLKGG